MSERPRGIDPGPLAFARSPGMEHYNINNDNSLHNKFILGIYPQAVPPASMKISLLTLEGRMLLTHAVSHP